jgi:phosphoglycerate dehydrogenase-like enzyme
MSVFPLGVLTETTAGLTFAILINTARGGIVDEKALLVANSNAEKAVSGKGNDNVKPLPIRMSNSYIT